MDKHKIELKKEMPPQPFVDCRGVSWEDDYLASVKSALGLPDDTPEPLVGAIWRLQQRIEDLEESLRLQGLEDGSIVRHRRRRSKESRDNA